MGPTGRNAGNRIDRFQLLPRPVLRPFVDRLWRWESRDRETIPLPTLLPGTGAELYFHYRTPFEYTAQDRKTRCDAGHLYCIRRIPLHLHAARNLGFIAVRFRIGMLHRFTEIPGTDLMDRVLSVEDIWGKAGRELVRRLSYAESHHERLARIQDFLVAQLQGHAQDMAVERGMSLLYESSPSLSIEDLANGLHLGRRQLERRFLQITGQSPREIRSISRFQRTVRGLMLDVSANPRDLALVNGYYDQAHFIHDFQRYAGMAPLRYLATARLKTHFYNTSRRSAGKMTAPDNHF